MSVLPADARRDLPLAMVAAATTWVTMLSWRGFSSLWGQYLGPLLLVALIVAWGVRCSAPRRSRGGWRCCSTSWSSPSSSG